MWQWREYFRIFFYTSYQDDTQDQDNEEEINMTQDKNEKRVITE